MMTHANTTLPAKFGRESLPALLFRLGKRGIFVGRNYRVRYYRVNPLFDCQPGVASGYLEILLLQRWLIVFWKAR